MGVQPEREMQILEYVEHNPDTTQADLAARLGVAVGSVNWYLQRLVNKGYVKVSKMQRRRLRYLITPQGIAEKARLTQGYMEASLRLYRETRTQARHLLAQAVTAGYSAVCVEGDDDLAEICRLTCLEQNVEVGCEADETHVPTLVIEGMSLALHWPQKPDGTGV